MALVFEVELPSVLLDPVILDTDATRLRATNRVPDPNETGVSATTDIEVLLLDVGTTAPGISTANTRLYVNGVLAYDGGSGTPFKPGFDGGGSSAVAWGANGLRVHLDTNGAPFASSSVVTVRAVTARTSGPETLDTSWVFTIADTTAPQVSAAVATGHKTVAVTFSEAMRMVGDDAVSDALRAAAYTFTVTTVPAVTPVVRSVRILTSNSVELSLDIELSQGAGYAVYVASATDLVGNAVEAPYDWAAFTGYSCPVPAGRKFNLYGMLSAKNRRDDETQDLAKFVACLQEIVNLRLCEIDNFIDFLDPDYTTDGMLDCMLLDLGNPFAFELTTLKKRQLVQLLIPIYKQKGTAKGIKNVVRLFLGREVTITPYALYGMVLGESELGSDGTDGTWELGPAGSAALYSFNVESAAVLTDYERRAITGLVEYMKPAHTHFIQLVEPVPPVILDHLELGESELGVTWDLH